MAHSLNKHLHYTINSYGYVLVNGYRLSIAYLEEGSDIHWKIIVVLATICENSPEK